VADLKVRLIMDQDNEDEPRQVLSAEILYVPPLGFLTIDGVIRVFEKAGHFPTNMYLSHSAWRALSLDPNHFESEMTPPDEHGNISKICGVPAKMKRTMQMGEIETLEIEDGAVTFRVVAREIDPDPP